MNKTVILIVTSAFTIAGDIARPGDLVEVTEAEAKNLLHRGKARVATEADGAPVILASGTDDGEPHPDIAEVNAEAERRKREAEEAETARVAQEAADAAAAAAAEEAAEVAAARQEWLTGMLDDNVPNIVAQLPGLADEALADLLDAEIAGKTRKGVTEAIEAEQAARATPNT